MNCKCGTKTVESYAGGNTFQYCRICKIEVHPAYLLKQLYTPNSLDYVDKTLIKDGNTRLSIEEEIFQRAALANRDNNAEYNVVFISSKNYLDLHESLGNKVVYHSLSHINGGKIVRLAGPCGYIQVLPSSLLNDNQYCFSTIEEN